MIKGWRRLDDKAYYMSKMQSFSFKGFCNSVPQMKGNPYEVIMICYLTMQKKKEKREKERRVAKNTDCIKTNLLTVSSAKDKNQAAVEACHMPLPSTSHFKCEALSPLFKHLK